MSSQQPQTESIYGLYYTGNGDRDTSLGGPGTTNRVVSGDINNFFPPVSDDLAIVGGKVHRVFILKNDSEDKISLKTSFITELISTNINLKVKIAISSTGINQDPIRLLTEDEEPPTELFVEATGKPLVSNIGDLRPQDYIGILIQMEIKPGAEATKGVQSIFSAIGESEPVPQEPSPDPGPGPGPIQCTDPTECKDPVTGLCRLIGPGEIKDSAGLCKPAPEPPRPLPIYKFISWGDNDTTSDAEDVLAAIMLQTGISAYLFAGDGPYASTATNWINMMNTYFDSIKKALLLLSQGNHEHPESETQTTENQIEAWMPGLNNANESLEWLQFRKVGNAVCIIMNSQDDDIAVIGGDQYNYVQARLNEAVAMRSRGEIDWIIIVVHKSWFNLLSSNQAYVLAREAYDAMFFAAQVDFVFHGHNHNVHIWNPGRPIIGNVSNTAMTPVFTLTDDGKYNFQALHGPIHTCNGNGGHEHNIFGQAPTSNVIFSNDTTYGYSLLTIQGKQAELKHLDTNNNVLFTAPLITRGNDVPPKPDPDPDPGPGPKDPPPCERGQHRDTNGVCVPNNCRPGDKWDPTANGGLGACVPADTPIDCGPGKVYDDFLQQCVLNDNPQTPIRNFGGVAVADFDCNSRTDRTFEMIQEDFDKINAVGDLGYLFAVGDLSYGSNENCWLQRVDALKLFFGRDHTFPAIGNHDDVESGSLSKRNAIINGFSCFPDTKGYYAVTLGAARVIFMDTQSNYDEGSDQYDFLVNQLQTAQQDGQVKWIIVCYHKPSLVSDSEYGPLTDFRDIYHPLFDQYHVNVVINGHNHVYYRSFPIHYNPDSPSNPIVTSTKTGTNNIPGQTYSGKEGTIYVTVGTGGRTRDSFQGDQEDYIAARSEEYGVMPFSCWDNGNNLAFFFHTHNGDQVDEFYFSKSVT